MTRQPLMGDKVLFHACTCEPQGFPVVDEGICPAIVTSVHSHCVNLTVFDSEGDSHGVTGVRVFPRHDVGPQGGGFWCELLTEPGEVFKREPPQ